MCSRLSATIMCVMLLASSHAVLSAPSQEQTTNAAVSTGNTPADPPHRGMTMKQVEKAYGPPVRKMDPTGNPPITRWVYKEYTVYFEKKYVIQSVSNKIKPVDASK